MNQIKQPHGMFCLIRLQMTDQMPLYLTLQRLRLIHCLLDAVFSDVHESRINGFLHGRDGMILRHGNQFYRCIL